MPASSKKKISTPSRSKKTASSSQKSQASVSKSKATKVVKLEDEEVLEISSSDDRNVKKKESDSGVDNDVRMSEDDDVQEVAITPSKKGSKRLLAEKTTADVKKSPKKRKIAGKKGQISKASSTTPDHSDLSEEHKALSDSDDVFQSGKGKQPMKKKDHGKMAYLDDPTSEEPPEFDESDIGTRDPALKATYEDLVNIRIARMHSWSEQLGNGQPGYSKLLKANPGINKALLRSAIVFQHKGKFANLSRVDPAIVSTGHLGHTYLHLVQQGARPLIFTSVILVDSCHVFDAKPAPNSKPVKAIAGALLEGEWERLIGCIGMILHERDFKAQLYKDNLSFTTAPSTAEDSAFSSPAKKGRLFSGQQSPFTRRPSTSFSKTTLSFNDAVPIYDGTNVKEQFSTILSNIEDLPSIKSEISPGSCVVVAYTVNTFTRRNDEMKSLSFNVQWIIVLHSED